MSRWTHINWNLGWKWIGRSAISCLLVLALGVMGCGDRPQSGRPTPLSSSSSRRFEEVVEVSPPAALQALRKELEIYQPQVRILSPQPGDIIDNDQVSVQLDVNDLPIFKDEELGLGPHLHILLDSQKYAEVYDIEQPLLLQNLAPGTHTLRVFASRPWHESFKNAGAYAQVTFSIFTDTAENNPAPDSPLLTYNQPEGTYGAQPILLDFYLTDAPLHVLARESDSDDLKDWAIRGTVNGQSFTFDTWEPIYLKGFVPGLNWVKLELFDEDGKVFDGPFNSTAHRIDYQPDNQDTLSQIIRGELTASDVLPIVDPDYEPQPELQPEPEPQPKTQPEPDTAPLRPESQSKPTDQDVPPPGAPAQERAEPEILEPEPPEPKATKPKATESEVDEPETTELETTAPEATTTEATEPEATEPEAAEPEAAEPEATEPEATEPEATELETAKPKPTELETEELKAIEPEPTQPESPAPAPGDSTQPTAGESIAEPGMESSPDGRDPSAYQLPAEMPENPAAPLSPEEKGESPPTLERTPQLQTPSAPGSPSEQPVNTTSELDENESSNLDKSDDLDKSDLDEPGEANIPSAPDNGQSGTMQPGDIQFDVPETVDEPTV